MMRPSPNHGTQRLPNDDDDDDDDDDLHVVHISDWAADKWTLRSSGDDRQLGQSAEVGCLMC